jgi:hypothetical protein
MNLLTSESTSAASPPGGASAVSARGTMRHSSGSGEPPPAAGDAAAAAAEPDAGRSSSAGRISSQSLSAWDPESRAPAPAPPPPPPPPPPIDSALMLAQRSSSGGGGVGRGWDSVTMEPLVSSWSASRSRHRNSCASCELVRSNAMPLQQRVHYLEAYLLLVVQKVHEAAVLFERVDEGARYDRGVLPAPHVSDEVCKGLDYLAVALC